MGGLISATAIATLRLCSDIGQPASNSCAGFAIDACTTDPYLGVP
jgi:hypothetical protein